MATPPGSDLDDAPPDGTRLTLREFVALPGATRAELVDGVFVRVPLGGPLHARTNARLVACLAGDAIARDLGEIYDCSVAFVLRLDPPLARSPDVSFVRRAKDDQGVAPDAVPLAPDLAAETLSTSNRAGEVQRRIEEDLRYGTELVWLIDPQRRTAAVYARDGSVRWLHEGHALDGGDVVPGFSVPLAFLFEDLAPPT